MVHDLNLSKKDMEYNNKVIVIFQSQAGKAFRLPLKAREGFHPQNTEKGFHLL